ncbi:MAG: hypothetical protein WBG42_15080 [Cryomorphaceae bacterium]
MRNLLVLIALLAFFGCSPDATLKEENEKLRSEKVAFSAHQKQEFERLNQTIDSLQANEQFMISIFPATLSKDTLLKMAVDRISVGGDANYNDILWDLSSLVNENRNKNFRVELEGNASDLVRLRSSDFFLHYVWMNLDRSGENIRSYFTDKGIEYAAYLIKDGYSFGGGAQLAEALAIAYKELEGKDKLLDDLYLRADTVHVLADPAYREIVSPNVKALLQEDYSDDPIVDAETRYNWVYSFWVRRHHEKNAEAVYDLITRLDAKVKSIIEDESDYYEE